MITNIELETIKKNIDNNVLEELLGEFSLKYFYRNEKLKILTFTFLMKY